MLNKVEISEIEKISIEQELFKNQIPFQIKSQTNYLWQIYYSEFINKYFMLVTIEDLEYSAFFYLLKKQIEDPNYEIFVPISYTEYNNNYLTKTEILEIENYIWFFTKQWPLVYELYNQKNKLSIQIIGETIIYENIKSIYKIHLETSEDAIKTYKLLKALFLLQTELAYQYKFKLNINQNFGLDFYYKFKKIDFNMLPLFIKNEYKEQILENQKIKEMKTKIEKKLYLIQEEAKKLDLEYMLRQKQIATYLEYRKTFLGKFKYYIKRKKFLKKDNIKLDKFEKTINKKLKENIEIEIKKQDYYTLEELIIISKQKEKNLNIVKNLKLDIEAGEIRNINIESKIKNAKLYIEEIDKHTKSIFEFWKFTNKDKINQLQAPDEIIKNKIKKTFNFEQDFEEFAKQLDIKQRNVLSKEETDSIFLFTTNILEDINLIFEKKEITTERIEQLKKKAVEEKKLLR